MAANVDAKRLIRRAAVLRKARSMSRGELVQAVLEFMSSGAKPEEQANIAARLDRKALAALFEKGLDDGKPDLSKMLRRLSSPGFKRLAAKHPRRPLAGSTRALDRALPGLTARQMAKETPGNIWENARHVKLTSIKRLLSKKTGRHAMLLTTTEPSHAHEPQPHKQRVDILFPAGTRDIFEKGTRLKVDCDCSYFLYNCEVALARRGAADIVRSNGQWPRKTNPRGDKRVCKHLIAIFKHLNRTPVRRRYRKTS